MGADSRVVLPRGLWLEAWAQWRLNSNALRRICLPTTRPLTQEHGILMILRTMASRTGPSRRRSTVEPCAAGQVRPDLVMHNKSKNIDRKSARSRCYCSSMMIFARSS